MSTVLKKITTEAKKIRKKNPRISWKSAVKQAGAKYRKSAPKKKETRSAPKKTVRRSSVKKKATTTRRKVSGYNSAFGAAMVAGVSESSALAMLKRKYLHDIGVLEARKYAATRKADKNKISKKISELKAKYRKIK